MHSAFDSNETSSFKLYLKQWSNRPLPEILAGMVSTFALIPEVIAFSYISGVTPSVALFSSLMLACILAVFGGRPGMITGAAGSVALVAAPLVHSHGFEYLIPATLLCGLLQILFGIFKLQTITRFVSSAVMVGFVNALGILIFKAQVPQILASTPEALILTALGIGIIYLVPLVFSAIPSPLIAIAVLSFISIFWHLNVSTIGDLGDLPSGLPKLLIPHVSFNSELLSIIAFPALAMAAVGLLESLMTADVVYERTRTKGNLRQECIGLGLGNIGAGLFGGIAGCGMIGQSVGNIRYGGIGRLSILVSGLFLITLMVLFHSWAAQVPMAALIAIMVMVSVSTFSWRSLRHLHKTPMAETAAMLLTVIPTVLTSNLALGVIVGVVADMIIQHFYPSPINPEEESDI